MTLLLALGAAAVVGATDLANIGRGRALYENHCQVCHTPRVHGRGHLPLTEHDMREIVVRWQLQEGLRWSDQDIDDVTAYLANVVYRRYR